MKIEDIIRRYKKKIECKTETMNDYKQSNNPELLNAVSVYENEIEEAELIVSALELSQAKADGRLVVNGQWKKIGMRPVGTRYTYYCSVCGGHGNDEMKYCPNCGAKMDKETAEKAPGEFGKKTLYEKFKTMSIEEMATYISAIYHQADYEDGDYDPGIMEMLKSPVEEG